MNKDSLGRLFKLINNIFECNVNNNLVELNITRSQIDILIYIHINTLKNVETNQIDIEKHFNLKNPTVTGIINRLEEKQLLVRLSSLKGANYKKLELTEKGIELLKQGANKADKVEKNIFGALDNNEQKQLKYLLKKILDYQKIL